jgi:choline dehydrogenase-like flavoprotein
MLQSIGLALIPGRGLFFTPELLSLVRFVTLGGSSIGAYATAFEPNYEIFEKHDIDLKPEVEAIKREIHIAPLADTLLGPSAQCIMASARDLGHPWEKLPKMIFQDKCRTGCDKCTMGCPYGAKWTAREYIDQAISHGSTILSGARVNRLLVDQNHISGVQFSKDGKTQIVSAPLVILSAGGIGTPLILQAAGIQNAGSNFFFDPLIVLVGTLSNLDDGREFPMAAGFHDPSEGYVLTDLIWPGWVRAVFTLRAGRVDRLSGHRRMISIMVKIRDDLGGTLTRHGWANKRLTENDWTRLKRGTEVARKILLHAGSRNIYHTGISAVHPGGTAKIGDVVDSNLKTKFENLYVCDCSVIPESWGLPPTITILALAKRLSKHLTQIR